MIKTIWAAALGAAILATASAHAADSEFVTYHVVLKCPGSAEAQALEGRAEKESEMGRSFVEIKEGQTITIHNHECVVDRVRVDYSDSPDDPGS